VRLLRSVGAQRRSGRINNIVFMGMGEPLDNLPSVIRAIRLLCHRSAFDFAPTHVTVSTVGIAERFAEFFASTRAELAVSLGAPDDHRRRQIIPAAAHYDLETLRTALLDALPRGRRVLFQYALFDGFNDAPDDADKLADFVEPVRCRVNVLVANRGPAEHLGSPSPERVHSFLERLHRRGVRTILRASRGADVGGACGQLAGAYRRCDPAATAERRPGNGRDTDARTPASTRTAKPCH
jgi:23S rRNA (adenine2503-C2)-methyltransferase